MEIADYLRKADYDAVMVTDQGLKGVDDSKIADVCKMEKRVIVTLDLDFSDVRTYPPEEYSGIMVLRVHSQNRQHIIDTFCRVIPLISQEPVKEHLWTIEETRVRIRGGEL